MKLNPRRELSTIYSGGKRIVVYDNGDVEEENLGEEANERWYINEENEPQRVGFGDPVEDIENLEELGLLFNTKEETKKAIEKLKAWKRLKDKGFRFDGYDVANREGDDVICGQIYFKAGNYDREEIEDDLFSLFGGKEE